MNIAAIHFPTAATTFALLGVQSAQAWERAGFLATSLAVSAVIASLYLRSIRKNEAAKMRIENDRENDRIAREAASQAEILASNTERKEVMERSYRLMMDLLVKNNVLSSGTTTTTTCKTENITEVHEAPKPIIPEN